MSAPHVSGIAALHLQKNPGLTPAQVWLAIRNDAIPVVRFPWMTIAWPTMLFQSFFRRSINPKYLTTNLLATVTSLLL